METKYTHSPYLAPDAEATTNERQMDTRANRANRANRAIERLGYRGLHGALFRPPRLRPRLPPQKIIANCLTFLHSINADLF